MFKIKKISVSFAIILGFISNILWIQYGQLLYPKSIFSSIDIDTPFLIITFTIWFIGVIIATSIIKKAGKKIFVIWVFLLPLIDLYVWIVRIL